MKERRIININKEDFDKIKSYCEANFLDMPKWIVSNCMIMLNQKTSKLEEYSRHFISTFDEIFTEKVKIKGRTVNGEPGILPINGNQFRYCSSSTSGVKDLITDAKLKGKEMAERILKELKLNGLNQDIYLSNELPCSYNPDENKEVKITSSKTNIDFHFLEVFSTAGELLLTTTTRIQIQKL